MRNDGRYGYRKIAGLLRQAAWAINDKRVERIWRREGLKVPGKQPRRGRLLAGRRTMFGPTTLSRTAPTMDAGARMLNVLDEFTHECLAIRVARKLKAIDVIDMLSDLFILRGIPGHIYGGRPPTWSILTNLSPHRRLR